MLISVVRVLFCLFSRMHQWCSITNWKWQHLFACVSSSQKAYQLFACLKLRPSKHFCYTLILLVNRHILTSLNQHMLTIYPKYLLAFSLLLLPQFHQLWYFTANMFMWASQPNSKCYLLVRIDASVCFVYNDFSICEIDNSHTFKQKICVLNEFRLRIVCLSVWFRWE